MTGSLFHHQTANRRAACKENIVKMLFQQSGVFRASALHHLHQLRRKKRLRHAANQPGSGGRIGRRLYHGAVARRQRSHQWGQRQLKGIVPRGHNQHHAVGLGQDPAGARQLPHGGQRLLRLHPAPEMLQRVRQFLLHHGYLGQIAFIIALAQILMQRIQNGLFVFADPALQLFQLLPAKFVGFCGLRFKILPLRGHHSAKICHSISSFIPNKFQTAHSFSSCQRSSPVPSRSTVR